VLRLYELVSTLPTISKYRLTLELAKALGMERASAATTTVAWFSCIFTKAAIIAASDTSRSYPEWIHLASLR
jgi:hypothetical protein